MKEGWLYPIRRARAEILRGNYKKSEKIALRGEGKGEGWQKESGWKESGARRREFPVGRLALVAVGAAFGG